MAVILRTIVHFFKNRKFPLVCRTVHSASSNPATQGNSEEDFNKPITYSTSKAATWEAEASFSGSEKKEVWPWYQPYVISISVAVFMLYFGVLREENDIDEKLGMTLYDRIDGLEEVQLKAAINYYKEHDKSYNTTDMEKRLFELQDKKKKT